MAAIDGGSSESSDLRWKQDRSSMMDGRRLDNGKNGRKGGDENGTMTTSDRRLVRDWVACWRGKERFAYL